MPEPDLTGIWQADDSAFYYIRHMPDNTMWWAGMHAPWYFHSGVEFTNVFRGVVDPGTMRIRGVWADVPRGRSLQSGNLNLDIVRVDDTSASQIFARTASIPPNGDGGRNGDGNGPQRPVFQLRKRVAETTGGFGGSVWTRSLVDWMTLPLDYRFANTLHGEGETLAHHLTPYRDFTVVFADLEGAGLGWEPIAWGVDYCTWISGKADEIDADGDLSLDVRVDRTDLDGQPGFWDAGWVRPPGPIQARLDVLAADGRPNNRLHPELMPFGRNNDQDHCRDAPSVLMPGWAETGGNSVLVNGQPLDARVLKEFGGQVDIAFRSPDPSQFVYLPLRPPLRLRLTGCLALDEHADPSSNDPEELLAHSAEVHPVYALDVVQDFSQPRPPTNLTGVWHCNDVGTYYLRQVDENTLCWLGLSQDQGRSFANIFEGTITADIITGTWADVPLGAVGGRGSGELKLVAEGAGPALTPRLTATQRTGGFGGSTWQKLYDRRL